MRVFVFKEKVARNSFPLFAKTAPCPLASSGVIEIRMVYFVYGGQKKADVVRYIYDRRRSVK